MLTAKIAGLALAAAAPSPLDEPAVDCSYDLDAMLALDRDAFDQDLDSGWRPLAARGCEAEAAELIRAWRHEKRDHNSILYWHEAQMRALAGQTEQAIALMQLTYKPVEQDATFGWNHYVTGSIAFLTRDRDGLRAAIERLKGIGRPSNLTFTGPDGQERQMAWPPNLHVLEAFERCWDRPYSEAYGAEECVRPASDD